MADSSLSARDSRVKDAVFIGARFGCLTVIGEPFYVGSFEKTRYKRTLMCVCECECGGFAAVRVYNLTAKAGFCGRHCPAIKRKTHDPVHHAIYDVWYGILERCFNPNCSAYVDYGGRGIGMCSEWNESLPAFEKWAIENGWRSGLHIDRINNDGNYEPSNCRFVTPKENQRNRRDTFRITAFGVTKSASEWAEDPRCSVSLTGLKKRIRSGWDAEVAITKQNQKRRVQ